MFNKKEYNEEWRKNNPDKVKKCYQEHYAKNKARIIHRVKAYYYKSRYNLTETEIEILLKKINYKCEICGQKEKAKDCTGKRVKRLAIDHDHKTNKVRGFLCDRCNRSLGYLDWFEQYNEKIELYLKRYQ